MRTNQATQNWDVMENLRRARDLVEPGLRKSIEQLPAPMRIVAGYHFGWWDENGRPTSASGGKAIRPALALLAAQVVSGQAESAVSAAVAVELVHNFSLLHDDVIDGDATRRHRPTVWSVFGEPAAILAGDTLLTLAVDVLAKGSSPAAALGMHRLCETLIRLVAGQSADITFERRVDVDLEECLAMAGDKTAALLACACELGALFAGASPSQAERLGWFGEHLGLAFQLADDLLGIWGDPSVTGKPVMSDLRTRKKSLPVVAALTAGNEASRALARLYLRPEPLAEKDLETAAWLVERAGGREWAEAEAQRHLAAALACVEQAGPDEATQEQVTALAHLIVRRDR